MTDYEMFKRDVLKNHDLKESEIKKMYHRINVLENREYVENSFKSEIMETGIIHYSAEFVKIEDFKNIKTNEIVKTMIKNLETINPEIEKMIENDEIVEINDWGEIERRIWGISK